MSRGFPGGASGKEPACQCRRHKRCRFDPWVKKIPLGRAAIHGVAKSWTRLSDFTFTFHFHALEKESESEVARSCLTLRDPMDCSPPGSSNPWDCPGKSTGVGCHFLLQCMKVKSESEAAQLCPTPSDPMDCSPPGSSIHGIFQARVLEWGAIAFSSA